MEERGGFVPDHVRAGPALGENGFRVESGERLRLQRKMVSFRQGLSFSLIFFLHYHIFSLARVFFSVRLTFFPICNYRFLFTEPSRKRSPLASSPAISYNSTRRPSSATSPLVTDELATSASTSRHVTARGSRNAETTQSLSLQDATSC